MHPAIPSTSHKPNMSLESRLSLPSDHDIKGISARQRERKRKRDLDLTILPLHPLFSSLGQIEPKIRPQIPTYRR